MFRKKYNTESDEALMRLIVQGDDKAFNVLYQRYSPKMYHYFYRMLYQNTNKAEDFTQELFIKIIEKATLFDPDKKFFSWIYTIASNMCKNEYRYQSKRKHLQHQAEDFTFEDYGEWSTDNIDPQIFQECLQEELNELSEAHRMAFVLRYQEDLSIKEISQILDCPEGTVKSRIFYTIKKLSAKLKIFDPKL